MAVRLAIALIVLLLPSALAACEGTRLPVERSWQLVLPDDPPAAALPVRVVDETGNVKLAELAGGRMPEPEGFGGADIVDGDDRRLLVGWTGGACDRSAEVRVTSEGGSWTVTVTTDVAPGGCRLIGIGRAVILDVAVAVEPGSVAVVSG
jgi:hypothetical protein